MHKAIMVLVLNTGGDVLLQKRSPKKMLWPLFWDVTCASHPHEGEGYVASGERRLREELGFSVPLRLLGDFYYEAKYQEVGIEREICGFLVGVYEGKVDINREEVAEVEWIGLESLLNEVEKPAGRNRYTPWLMIGVRKFAGSLRRYRDSGAQGDRRQPATP